MSKLTFSRFVVVTTLCILILVGVAVGGIELYHLAHQTHSFSWIPFAWAAGLMILPALALDTTGAVKRAVDTFSIDIPRFRTGRRETDPVVVPVTALEAKKEEGLG